MDERQLEMECRALADLVDTEVMEGDPVDLPSFDATTLYVWMVPDRDGGDEPGVRDERPAQILVRGRIGSKYALAPTVRDLARQLGVKGA